MGLKGLAPGTVSNTLTVIRSVFGYAVDGELLEANPASKLGRGTKATATQSDFRPVALSPAEVARFLESVQVVCPEYYPLFVLALRAGLRRGELVAVRWGDFEFGAHDQDPNRYVMVQHNFVKGQHTTTKSRKARRVDMSRELRRVLLEHREPALLRAFQRNESNIADQVVFPSPDGCILHPK